MSLSFVFKRRDVKAAEKYLLYGQESDILGTQLNP